MRERDRLYLRGAQGTQKTVKTKKGGKDKEIKGRNYQTKGKTIGLCS